jgi:hypothetical protein
VIECTPGLISTNPGFNEIQIYSSRDFSIVTELNDNFSFKANERAYIEFTCPNKLSPIDSSKFPFYDFLKCSVFDKNRNEVDMVLKDKVTENKRIIRIYFTPPVTGIYKLSIKYCDVEIPEGPFSFVVMPQAQGMTHSDSNSSFISATSILQSNGSRLNEFLNNSNGGMASRLQEVNLNNNVEPFRMPDLPDGQRNMADRLSTTQTIASIDSFTLFNIKLYELNHNSKFYNMNCIRIFLYAKIRWKLFLSRRNIIKNIFF